MPVALLNKDFFSLTLFSFALYRFTLLCSGKGDNDARATTRTARVMTGMARRRVTMRMARSVTTRMTRTTMRTARR